VEEGGREGWGRKGSVALDMMRSGRILGGQKRTAWMF
jgi:hypothetical protein